MAMKMDAVTGLTHVGASEITDALTPSALVTLRAIKAIALRESTA